MGGVISLETSLNGVELVRYRDGDVHSSWFIPFKACDVVNALPHTQTLFLYCRLVDLIDLLRS